MVNPATYMIKKDAINDTGIAKTGINVVRQLRKKRKMIKTTKRKASKIVSSTSLIELRINTVLSKAIVASISSGRSFSKSCITIGPVRNINVVCSRLGNQSTHHHGKAVTLGYTPGVLGIHFRHTNIFKTDNF